MEWSQAKATEVRQHESVVKATEWMTAKAAELEQHEAVGKALKWFRGAAEGAG